MKFAGFELRNFRSIGEESVVLHPWKKCNILIGKNNSGKSNIIRLLKKLLDGNIHRGISLGDTDHYQLDKKIITSFSLYFEIDPTSDEFDVLLHKVFHDYFSTFRFDYNLNNVSNVNRYELTNYSLADSIYLGDQTYYERLYSIMSKLGLSKSIRRDNHDLFVESLRGLADRVLSRCDGIVDTFQPYFIPQFRQISTNGDEPYEFNGNNLIREVRKWDRPDRNQPNLRDDKFIPLQNLVQKLLHLPDAKLQLPDQPIEINIDNGGIVLPLDSFGTGVHELIILAVSILSVDDENAVICIEEPEIHLHPTLQREFIEFITTETKSQYIISTHSPTLINVQTNLPVKTRDSIQVFHIKLNEHRATVGRPVLETTDALIALNDLGVRPSDLLQSNCVIWVEGPSDRVYINRWLELMDGDLIEGLHYSIMFYGGKSLSHLNANRKTNDEKDAMPDDFIELLKINQRAIVVMDSDRGKKGARIDKTKLRIKKECEESESLAWVTDGREIENYLEKQLLDRILNDIKHNQLKGKEIAIDFDEYSRLEDSISKALRKAGVQTFTYTNDKVGYARKFAEKILFEDMGHELKKQMNQVINKIQEWNDLK